MHRVFAHRPLRATLTAVLALLSIAVVASPATANIPAPITKTNPIRVPALGNATDGTLTTRVTYSDTAATATASTGSTISLGSGWLFRLQTCVAYHLNGTPPTSRCAERTFDTRGNTGSVFTFAPTVTLSGRPRPTTQPWGYLTPYTEVLYLSGSTWVVAAQSWPDNGLQGAGIAVAAQGQNIGTLPPNGTVTLDGPFTSAINNGQPDSICTANPTVSDGSPLPAGVSTSHPAFTGAPTYYEVGLPSGHYAGQSPRGVMLVLHGGGWAKTGVGAVQFVRADAQRWRNRGWETVNFTYRSCGQSLDDALWFYDKARAWFDPRVQICALGTSAGGHLSLLIGAYRSGLYCVVSQAGPTDLRIIQNELAYDTVTGLHDQTLGGRWVHNLAAGAFGEENLAQFSPAALASPSLNATRVLQAFSADDPLVSFQQAADLAGAMRLVNATAYVDNVQLAAGTIPFAHGRVTQAALTDFYARERQLVAPLTAPVATPVTPPTATPITPPLATPVSPPTATPITPPADTPLDTP
jgi:acetyl esterase/lipase